MTKRRWMTALGWLALGWLAPAIAEEAPRPDPAGEWTSLFDGKTLGGWESLALGKQASNWEVKDGAIEGSGGPSMLYSPRGDYKNFRFRAELKINDKGNSGMYVRSAKVPAFTGGYEIQVNSTHTDPIKTGSLHARPKNEIPTGRPRKNPAGTVMCG